MNISKQIKQYMKNNNINQSELSRMLGLSPAYISKVANGFEPIEGSVGEKKLFNLLNISEPVIEEEVTIDKAPLISCELLLGAFHYKCSSSSILSAVIESIDAINNTTVISCDKEAKKAVMYLLKRAIKNLED